MFYEIRYARTLGATDVFEVTFAGSVVFRVTASTADPHCRIRISRPNGTGVQATEGTFVYRGAWIDHHSVKRYVLGNARELMALILAADLVDTNVNPDV